MNKSKELVNMNEFEQQQNAEIFEVLNKSLKLFDQQNNNENQLIEKNRNKQKIELQNMDKTNLYEKQDKIGNERQYYYHTRSKKISILQNNNNKRKKEIKNKKKNNNHNKSISKEEQEEQEEEQEKKQKEKEEKNISKKEKIEIKKKEKNLSMNNQQLLNCKNKNKKIPKFVLKAKQQLQSLLKQQKQKQGSKQRQKIDKREINLQQQQQKLFNIESSDSDKVEFIESIKVIKKDNTIKVYEIDDKNEEKINIDLKKKRRTNKIKKNNKNRQKNEQYEQNEKIKFKQNVKKKQKQQKLLKRKQEKLRKPIIKNLIVTKNSQLIPVDQYFSKFNQVKVLFLNSAYYSATLTQSNIVKNDNKFYIVQILEQQQNQDKCWLFSRWGRIGVTGQKTENGPISRKQAIRHYHNKIQDKIKIGHYKVLENHYGSEQRCETEQIQLQIHEKRSQLNIKVQQLLHLIFDKKMMNNHMKQIGYNDKKLPLGLLGKYNIKKGYESLNDLQEQLKNSNKKLWQKKDKLNELSSQFYSAIPHDFGYINMQAYILDTQNKIKQKLLMLQSLQDIQIYTKFINQKQQNNNNKMNHINQLDAKYLKLHTKIEPLDKRNEIYEMLMKYIQNTHALTHDKYSLEVEDIFTIDREEQKNQYKSYLDNKQLLWHGSRLTNYVGILCQGLKIAPLYAPITGYMFGKGIYFADMVSKSANYCLANRIYNQGLLLLCQVALGDMNLKYGTDFNASNLPQGKQSTKGVGKTAPGGGQLLDDIWVPNGKIAPNGITETNLLYNQYVVYDVTQIRCRFIVKVKFDFK